MSQRTFSINELIVVYGGIQITGFIDGEFITVSYDDEIFKHVNGADGEVARIKSNKLMATATIRLLQTSLTNDVLSGFLLADIAENITQLFIIKDLNGNTILSASQCSISKFSDVGYGTENVNREWTIKIPKLLGFVGGNFIN